MSNVAIDLTKTVKEIIETMKTAIDNLNTNVDSLKSEVLLAAHPVGSYYISDNSTDPGTLFGGTWKMLDPGLTLISQGKGTDKFGSFEFVAGQTYGERMHQLTIEELPERTVVSLRGDDTTPFDSIPLNTVSNCKTWGATCLYDYIYRFNFNLRCNLAHNTMQSSKAVYIWLRTA